MFTPAFRAAALFVAVAVLNGCLSSGGDSPTLTESGGGTTVTPAESTGRTFLIKPGPNATDDMTKAMVQLKPKDTLKFDCGFFDLKTGIQITATEDVVIEGCGINDTVLSFRDSNTQEGFLASNVMGVTIRDLTIADSPGDAYKMKGVNHGNLLRVRAIWSSGRKTPQEVPITAANFKTAVQVKCTDPARHNPNNPNPLERDNTSPDYTVSTASGRYGIYPVQSRNILVDGAESIGASDAGIYVGQTNIAKIRNSRAAFNVFGFEIENVQDGEYLQNVAECNSGGFLVYDLDNLTQYGSRSRVHKNIARNNNTYNFAVPGSIVANVPRGSGLITLAYDKIDIYDNVFENNGTAGVILTSYDMLGDPGDRRMDVYSEAVNIFNNTFTNNGNDLPQPDFATIIATQGAQISSAFPMVVGLKNAAGGKGYKGGHIVWDGYQDTLNQNCALPLDKNGKPVAVDADGKPIQGNTNPNPACRYNAYKFKPNGERKVPAWWFSCINPSNKFNADSIAFANFHGTRGLDALVNLNTNDPSKNLSVEYVSAIASGIPLFASEFDLSKHNCAARFGADLPKLPDFEFEPFVPSGQYAPEPAAEAVKALCEVPLKAGVVNEAAYQVNCNELSQYNLFSKADDPTSKPNGQGMPYTLNSKLFTDYAVKHRVMYIPEGKSARFLQDESRRVTSTIEFPVGTIIAKTFTFVDQTAKTETPYETRLLIKRERKDGQKYWEGLEYIWQDGGDGKRKAVLTQSGGTGSAKWDYVDTDSGVRHTGQTNAYLFPNATQCAICHANNDKEPGSSPIGPKPRNLNRAYLNESPMPTGQASHPVTGKNQLKFMCDTGLMTNCPDSFNLDDKQVAKNVPHLPKFNVPGDSGQPANSKADIEARARAWIEVNCAHCHNENGQASNTGFYVDAFRAVDSTYGICKKPTASGSEGRGNRLYDIHPGQANDSIVPYRIGPEAVQLAAKMPPLGRSVVQDEAVTLITQWINTVIDSSYKNADACQENNQSGGGLPLVGGLPLLPK
ncbi:MAG TPA: parallel beta-helix domain-containing protein [Limnobacter sp.]|uniref:parallel beta-helix domain-containing protein n=1 Tax=Limnobacter sp. TaxID=2003368 RepID=UPI002ED84357